MRQGSDCRLLLPKWKEESLIRMHWEITVSLRLFHVYVPWCICIWRSNHQNPDPLRFHCKHLTILTFFFPSFSNPRLEQSGKYLHQSQSCDAHWSFETTRGAASLINHSWKTKPVITGKTSSQEECILGMNVNPRAVLPPNDKQAGCRKGWGAGPTCSTDRNQR